MISDGERRLLEELERRLHVEDPVFARRFEGEDTWSRWRTAWRRATSVPALLIVVALCVTSYVVGVSSLGVTLLVWALVGTVARLRRSGRDGHRASDPTSPELT